MENSLGAVNCPSGARGRGRIRTAGQEPLSAHELVAYLGTGLCCLCNIILSQVLYGPDARPRLEFT
jgi:hypothetical protein